MRQQAKTSCEPAKLLRSFDLPAFAPVARTSLLWVSNTDDDPFRKATGLFSVLSPHFRDSSLRSRAQVSMQLRRTPTAAPSGEAPLCMVHKVAQEASRRTNPRTGTYARGGAAFGPYVSR
jgi:hypothetical protein